MQLFGRKKKKQIKKAKRVKKQSRRFNEHNFDKELTDEEFFDIVDN